jgi:hypothetical protein
MARSLKQRNASPAAQQATARAAAKTNAAEIRKLLTAFAAAATDIDEALGDFATSSHELRDVSSAAVAASFRTIIRSRASARASC